MPIWGAVGAVGVTFWERSERGERREAPPATERPRVAGEAGVNASTSKIDRVKTSPNSQKEFEFPLHFE